MKVLFVGDGRHDIGRTDGVSNEPQPAGGVVPTLSRRLCPNISADSLAFKWKDIPRFQRGKNGYAGKVPAAALKARQYGCMATICVVDRDRDDGRSEQLEDGKQAALKVVPGHPVVCGVAVESIEAWTLGAPDALAAELKFSSSQVHKEYTLARVETFCETSGKEDHRPKALLERMARLAGRGDDVALREAVAERTDVTELAKACPQGFKPFADELRRALGVSPGPGASEG
jgi:hypothetical protein